MRKNLLPFSTELPFRFNERKFLRNRSRSSCKYFEIIHAIHVVRSTHSVRCLDQVVAGAEDDQVVQAVDILDDFNLVAKNVENLQADQTLEVFQLRDRVVSQVELFESAECFQVFNFVDFVERQWKDLKVWKDPQVVDFEDILKMRDLEFQSKISRQLTQKLQS